MPSWPFAASLALLSCNLTPAALSIAAAPKVISGTQRSKLSVEALEAAQLPGGGTVRFSAPFGDVGTDTLTLDDLGSARTTFSCAGCNHGIVPITAIWRSRRGEVTAQTEVLVADGPALPETPVDGGPEGPCTVTLSGSLNDQVPCYLSATQTADPTSMFRYSIQSGLGSAPPGLRMTFSFLSVDLRVRSYVWSDRAPGGALVIQSGTTSWGPTGSAGGNDPVSFALNLTSVSFVGERRYVVHGTLDAELAPQRAPGEPLLGPEWNVKVQAAF